VLSTLAAFGGAFFAVFMMFGAGFTAIVLAVTRDRMLAQFAGTFGAVADTFTVDHESDSIVVVVKVPRVRDTSSK
jgi:hypothetical protein